VSKLFDKLKNAARSRGGEDPRRPSAMLSEALRRAADERLALRAASPSGPSQVIVIERVEPMEASPQEQAQADERLASAARDRAEADAQAAEELRLRREAERALHEAAAQRAQAELEAAEVARLRIEAEERATLLAREREETERSAAREALGRASAEREATLAVQERLRLERSAQARRSRRHADAERRRLRRNLVLALIALAVIGGVIAARSYLPGYLGDHGATPTFQLDRELKSTDKPRP
jgi:hypothetical protein